MSSQQIDIIRELRTAMKTGKVILGTRKTLKSLLLGKSKLVVITSNVPPEVREDVYRYAKLSGVKVVEINVSSVDLGAMLGKPFSVALLSVVDPGESNILNVT